MAEKEDKKAPKADKAAKADKAPKPKAERAAKAKADAAAKAGEAEQGEREPEPKGPSRLHKHFDEVIRAKLTEQFGYKNRDGSAARRQDRAQHGRRRSRQRPQEGRRRGGDLAMIAGQKAVITHARKSIATFKLRESQAIGCKVTLRRTRMYEFLDRLVNIALPRVRDFRGLNPKSFDGRGNYAIGIKEHIVFPEIDYDKAESILGHGHHRLHDGEERRRSARVARGIQFPVPAVSGDEAWLKRGKGEERLMAKTSSIEKNKRRARLAKQYAGRRATAEGDRARQERCRWRSASRRRSSSPSCRAIPRRCACATAAK